MVNARNSQTIGYSNKDNIKGLLLKDQSTINNFSSELKSLFLIGEIRFSKIQFSFS